MQLTENQKQAVESIDKPTAIIAGAGSGKTEVLTQRLLKILESGNASLSQILCITFTDKSALEMKRRIAKALPQETRAHLFSAPIGTFHGFFLNLIRENAPLLGLSEWMSVWDEHTAKLAIHRHCRAALLKGLDDKDPDTLAMVEQLEFRNALLLFEELLQFRWHAEKHLQNRPSFVRRGRGEVDLPHPNPTLTKGREAVASLFQKISDAYDFEKKTRQVLDFQDLEILTLQLLTQHKESLKKIQSRFKHILVDEVQDTNDLQHQILKALFAPPGNILCVVGDPKQSIYRFRGANVEGFQSISKLILENKGHLIDLKENFRSRPAIIHFINHLFSKEGLQSQRDPAPETGLELMEIEPPSGKNSSELLRKTEAKAIARYIQNHVRTEGKHYGDIALLFQSLNDARFYEQALRDANIPYRLSGGRGFLNAQEVIDLIFCLKLLVNPADRLALAGLLRSPLIGMSDVEIQNLHSNWLNLPQVKWFADILSAKDQMTAAEVFEEAMLKTHYDSLVYRLDPSGTKLANIEQLIELTRELETEEDLSKEEIAVYLEELKKRKARLANAPSADIQSETCQLTTVHAAKGLEFPVVILPDLIRGQPPHTNRHIFSREAGLALAEKDEDAEDFRRIRELESAKDVEEKKRLLYVALTRAEEKIVIPRHEKAARAGGWHGWIQEALENFTPSMKGPKPQSGREEEAPRALPVDGGRFDFILQPREKEPKKYFTVTELANVIPAPDVSFPRKRESRGQAQYRDDILAGAALGNLVHAVLKEYPAKKQGGLLPCVTRKSLDLEMRLPQEALQETAHLVEAFLNGAAAPESWQGAHEIPFCLRCPNGFVTGIIDYYFETPKGIVICDFKTDAKIESRHYQFQMDTYALALSEALSKPVLETRLLYLKHNAVHAEPCPKARLAKASEELIKRIDSFRLSQ